MAIEMSARIGTAIVGIAQARGLDVPALLAATGFDPAIGRDPDATIAIEVEQALWQAAERQSGDPWFGLHAAAYLRPGAFDVLDYAVRTAPTLRAALDRLVRYNRLAHGVAVFTVVDRDDRVRIEHRFAASTPTPPRHSSEFTLASLCMIGTQMLQAPVRALAVELPNAPPADAPAVYEAVFGVVPRFGTAVGAVELARDIVERPCAAPDPVLSDVILRQADAMLATRPDPLEALPNRVRKIVSRQLAEGAVSLASAARALHMSERSLQRKLAGEGITFDALVDDVRRELALRHLADPKLAIGEVAYLLGYSEPSAFHRAFKRWTGSTPAEVRAARGTGA